MSEQNDPNTETDKGQKVLTTNGPNQHCKHVVVLFITKATCQASRDLARDLMRSGMMLPGDLSRHSIYLLMSDLDSDAIAKKRASNTVAPRLHVLMECIMITKSRIQHGAGVDVRVLVYWCLYMGRLEGGSVVGGYVCADVYMCINVCMGIGKMAYTYIPWCRLRKDGCVLLCIMYLCV